MARLPDFQPRLNERLTAEFLAHSLELLPFSLRQPDAMLDASALRFERPEPPRDPDLPLLEPKIYPRPRPELVEAAVRSLVAPPAVDNFVGRKAELDQAVLSLLSERPVVITGASGSGKTALLRQIAHDPRIRKHFKRIWWLGDLEYAGTTIGLALNAPNVLRADPTDQPHLAREFLVAAGTLLLVDNAGGGIDQALKFTPSIVVVNDQPGQPEALPAATHVHLEGLTADSAVELLVRLSGQSEAVARALAKVVDCRPGAIGLLVALIVEDGISPEAMTDFLNKAAADQRDQLQALYAASYDALPEAYQALCQALAASPRQWIEVATILASYDRPLVGQRVLTFIERRKFIERIGDAVRTIGLWVDDITPGKQGFAAIVRPASRFSLDSADAEEVVQARTLHAQGAALIDQGRDDEAEAALKQALALRQTHDTDHAVAETLAALARLAYLHGEDALAIQRLESAAERLHALRDEESLEVIRIALSRVYRRAGRLDAALSVLGDDAPPEDLTAVYRARQEWPEAIAVYERWADQKPFWARLGVAETQVLAGRCADALSTLGDNDRFEAQWLRAMIYHIQGHIAKAQDLYMRLRVDVPSALRAAFARGYARALAASGEAHDAAMIVGAEGVWYEAKMPRPVFARQRLSLALSAHFNFMLGKLDEADAAARRALSITDERPDPEAESIAYRVLGRAAWQRGELDAALSAFDSELAARGSAIYRDEHEIGVTLHNIADLQQERGEPDRAVANYRRALTHKDAARDRYSVLLTRLALRDLLVKIGRTADALEAGQEAIDLALRRPEADLQPLGYALTVQTKAQMDFGRQARGVQALDTWLSRLAERASEGVAHPYWGVRALAIGLCLRSLSRSDGIPSLDDPITLVDLAEQAVQAAEIEAPGTWVAWAARRDLGNAYLLLERWADAYEVFAPLLTASPGATREGAVPGHDAPFVTLAAHLGSARAAARLGRIDDAIQHFDAARAFEPDQHACGLIVLEAANAYREAGDDAHAAERYVEALALLDRERSLSTYVDSIVTLAYTRLRLRRFGDAIDTFEQALGIVEQLPNRDSGLMASVLFDMATAHHTLGQYKRAAATYKRALEYQDVRSAPERYVETLVALARSYALSDARQPALEAYHEALQFDILAADLRRELLSEQAEVFTQVGLTQAAIDSYRSALAIEGGTNVERAAMHRGLGALYSSLNDHDKARAHFEAALAFVQDAQTGLTLRALGEGYRAQGQMESAISTFMRALAELDRDTYPVELAATERALGEIYLGFGQATDALSHLESALEIERALPQQDGGRIVRTLQRIAEGHELRGEVDRAIRRHHEALVYQDVRHAPEEYVGTLCTLGRLYAKMERYNEAIKAFDEALSTENRQPAPDPNRIDEITHALAEVYRAQGRLEAAANLYRRVTESANATPTRERSAEALQAAETEIARHVQTLRAAEQSWALLSRGAEPDLKGLAFVRALQAQTSAALGRWEDSDGYLEQLMQLLKENRSKIQANDPQAVIRALAMLLQGLEHEEAQRYDVALATYKNALEMAERDFKSDSALIWVIRRKAGRTVRKSSG